MVATGDTPLGMLRKWRIPMREASTNACAAAAHAGGAVMIDVREPYEYLAGHVPGAQSVPMTRLAQVSSALPRTEPVYVTCAPRRPQPRRRRLPGPSAPGCRTHRAEWREVGFGGTLGSVGLGPSARAGCKPPP
jgi:hypothetical protein